MCVCFVIIRLFEWTKMRKATQLSDFSLEVFCEDYEAFWSACRPEDEDEKTGEGGRNVCFWIP